MQKISNLILMAAVVVSNRMPVFAQTSDVTSLLQSDLETCFAQVERLMRLKCYDDLLKRPQISDDIKKPDDPKEASRVARVPFAIDYALNLLGSKDTIEDQVKVSLFETASGKPASLGAFSEKGLIAYLKAQRTQEELKNFKLENDLFLAIESDSSIGDAATMVLSCENNISRLKVIFGQPFEGRFVDARFYGSKTLTDEVALQRKLRVRQEGYLLENARGLDSIQLISRLIAGDLSQIAVGNGGGVRSAFFATDALKKALPLLAKHCSWSTDSTK